jgi:hypothetical protein
MNQTVSLSLEHHSRKSISSIHHQSVSFLPAAVLRKATRCSCCNDERDGNGQDLGDADDVVCAVAIVCVVAVADLGHAVLVLFAALLDIHASGANVAVDAATG